MSFASDLNETDNANKNRLIFRSKYSVASVKICESAYPQFSSFPTAVANLKVVLVEDSPAVRERLAESLRNIDRIELIGEYEDAKTAIDGIRDGAPDVVLLDIKLRGSSGMEVMRYIAQTKTEVRVIVLTNYAEPQYRELFLRQGAHAVLDKSHEFHRIEELLLRLINAP